MNPLDQALAFRKCMGQPIGTNDPKVLRNQHTLIHEEYREFEEAMLIANIDPNPHNKAEALKELSDLVYVCYQFAAAAGWELDEALDRVHESNMSKLVDGKPMKRADGKVLKGPFYNPPYLEDLV